MSLFLAAVDVLPQPSLAVNVLVCEREQSVLDTDPSFDVIVGSPHASVAVAVPSAAVMALDEGLHPSGTVVNVLVNPGAVTSSVQVTVLAAVDVLPQPSLAVNVLVCEREQSVLDTDPSLDVIVGSPHASVAVAVPSAAVIALDEGLHPSGTVVNVLVNPGAVTSSVHVTVLDVVAVLSQPSLAVQVLVCDLLQPLLTTGPSVIILALMPQLSVAPATPSEASTCDGVGLQLCKAGTANIINPGGILSSVHVTVLAAVDVLPQPSLAVNVLVCEREQSVLDTDPSLDVIVGSPHASVAVAVPSAVVMALDEGLHPSGTVVNVLVNPGAVTSSVHVTVLDVVAVLSQPSLAVQVLVCDLLQPLLTIGPSAIILALMPTIVSRACHSK
jgi:hypothetical protein